MPVVTSRDRRPSTRIMFRTVLVLLGVIAVGAACDASDPVSIVSTTSANTSSTTIVPATTMGDPTTTVPTTTTTTIPLADVVLATERVDGGFDNPVLLVADPDGGPDFVVQQTGSIVRADGAGHAVALDISDDVHFGGEQGLLGLAFHPSFASNRLAYVYYIERGPRTVIEQFEVVDGRFDTSSRLRIMDFDQPAANHNGGMIAFGPNGYLWIGLGDGGRSNNSLGHAQDPSTLFGSMLRIAVGEPTASPYGVPEDNPYADGADGRQEVWAIGLRNPWRFAFDGDDLWIADVGQAAIEEVNLVDAHLGNLNYGWSIMEGSECFRSSSCQTEGLVVPIVEYSHDEGCSITGGVVYRGDAIPSLRGQFFYADFCTGILRSVDNAGRSFDWTGMVGALANPIGFGTGSDGEVYVTTQGGDLVKIVEGA